MEITQDSYDAAKARGAIALFGEKYDDVVRTVEVPDFSLELCGGTHVKRTGQIGLFVITYESSIAAGVRRIEAYTGIGGVKYLQNARNQINRLSDLLNANESQLDNQVEELLENRRRLEKELEKLSSQMLSGDIQTVLEKAEDINGIKVISYAPENSTMAQLKELGDQIRNKSKETIAILGTINEGKISFVCVVTDDLIKSKDLKAGELIKKIAKIVNGGGGGHPFITR